MSVQLHHLGLVCRDLERTAQFYLEALGATRSEGPGFGHLLLTLGHVRLALVPWRPGDPEHPGHGQHLALSWPRAERADRLAQFERLALPWQEVGERIYLRDPEGFTLELLFEGAAP